ncbi:MAG: hypothetical protein KKF44_11715 [Nanoarchaeota archaeon]|nr:hypothetical protein [Nanoarchaeota archaeon]
MQQSFGHPSLSGFSHNPRPAQSIPHLPPSNSHLTASHSTQHSSGQP